MNPMKSILITGISSGIGHYLAHQLCPYFKVFGTVRTDIDKSRLEAEGANFEIIIMDISDPDSIASAFVELGLILQGKKLYGLINNSGIAIPGPLAYLSMSKFEYQLNVNVLGQLRVIQNAFPFLLNSASEGSRIINISSVSGMIGAPFLGAYVASKFALEGMSDSLRRECALLGIKVIIIEPGPIKTLIWQKNLGIADTFKHTPFYKYMEKADELIKATEENALPLSAIKKPILNALQSNRPRNRYVVHKKPLFVRLAAYFLPSKYLDYMVLKTLKSGKHKIRPV